MQTMSRQLQSLLGLVRKMQADRSAREGDTALEVTITSLRATAWKTAGLTGVLSYMKYKDAQRYAQVYDLQGQFLDAQRRALDSVIEVESYGVLLQGDRTRISGA